MKLSLATMVAVAAANDKKVNWDFEAFWIFLNHFEVEWICLNFEENSDIWTGKIKFYIKVPPRHPLNRLNKLKKFYEGFAADIVASRISEKAADRFAARYTKMCDGFQAAFDRPNCGYYDDSSKHGGPDPNPNVRPNGKPRNRRDDDDESEIEADFEDLAAFCAENAGDFSKSIFAVGFSRIQPDSIGFSRIQLDSVQFNPLISVIDCWNFR